jgi:hypothetical protein
LSAAAVTKRLDLAGLEKPLHASHQQCKLGITFADLGRISKGSAARRKSEDQRSKIWTSFYWEFVSKRLLVPGKMSPDNPPGPKRYSRLLRSMRFCGLYLGFLISDAFVRVSPSVIRYQSQVVINPEFLFESLDRKHDSFNLSLFSFWILPAG